MKYPRGAVRSMVWSVSLLILGIVGCAQEGAVSDDVTKSVSDNLFRTGTVWPNGTVPVCFSGTWDTAKAATVPVLLANSWGRAANITFTGFNTCASLTGTTPGRVKLTYVSMISNTDAVGYPGVGHERLTQLQSDAPSDNQFRYQVIHEFGHVLGYAHEMQRDENATGSYCNQTEASASGTKDTSFYDADSVMNYCANQPLATYYRINRTVLSGGDILGVRVAYGRNNAAHGFMIKSDTDPTLAVTAASGASDGASLKLWSGCTKTNPQCTWSYQYGMIVSDQDPTLAINAYGGAANLTLLRLVRVSPGKTITGPGDTASALPGCSPDLSDCTWTYKNGEFLSDTDPTLAMNAYGGGSEGAQIVLASACTAANTDCSWTLNDVMLSNLRDSTLAINAWGGATNGTVLKLTDQCGPSNSDCRWQFSHGMLLSASNTTLAVNAYGGASNGGAVKLVSGCPANNTDCTWTWKKGQLLSDSSASISIGVPAGATSGAALSQTTACANDNPDCVFSGYVAAP